MTSWLALGLASAAVLGLALDARAAGRALPAGATVRRDPVRGTITWVSDADLSADLEGDPAFRALQTDRRWAAVALAFLDAHADAFGLDTPRAELRPIAIATDDLGLTHVRFEQTYAGLPVRGGELIVHLDRDAHVTGAAGRYVSTPRGCDTAARLDPQQAMLRAATAVPGMQPPCTGCTAERVIVVDATGHPQLAYRVLADRGIAGRFEVLVHADSGAILDRGSSVRTTAPVPGGTAR